MQGIQLCTFGWYLIGLLQISPFWNSSHPGGIKSRGSLFVWPQMDRNTRLLWIVVIVRSTSWSTTLSRHDWNYKTQ
uniref:Uncharacterized protein n=1 Tax=Lepeophtheirus salmonis TaxID=72036 RepID=A0A0K2V0Y7_LEPSM